MDLEMRSGRAQRALMAGAFEGEGFVIPNQCDVRR
jgi:hypothetical protein